MVGSDDADDRSLEDLEAKEQRALTYYFLHQKCGYRFTPDGLIWELTTPEIEMLWAGYWLWLEFCDPQTAGNQQSEEQYDEQGRYRSSGSAKNASKADRDFYNKYEKYKNKVNSEESGANPRRN